MAGYAFPTVGYNSRAVSPREYEDLASPQAPDGLIGTPDMSALVYADSTLRGVKVRANRAALLRGLRWESGISEVSLTLAANGTAGTTRRDLIVLRQTRNPTAVALAVVQGVASASPVTPSATYGEDTSTGVWELPLAVVEVPYNDALTDAAQCTPSAWYVGKDGQLMCTPTTRPPHERGRVVWEHPTGSLFVSDGTSQWMRAADNESGLVTPVSGITFISRFLHRRNGMATMALTIHRPNAAFGSGTWTRIGEVTGDDFKPIIDMPFTGVVPSTGQVFTGIVEAGGSILLNPGAQSILENRYLTVSTFSWPTA